MRLSRRQLLAATLLSGCAKSPQRQGCDALRDQGIRWIVPFAPGGGNDFYSRLISRAMGKVLGAGITVTNEPGGGSMVGLTKLRDAAPDGRTLGTVNAPGALAASIAGQAGYPSPARDFTVLGRLVATKAAIVTGAQSGIRSMQDLFDLQQHRPIAAGVTGVASTNFLNLSVTSWLLGLRVDYVAGFNGSAEIQLAALRGDIDIVSNGYENLENGVRQGDLRMLLQISNGPIVDTPDLRAVDWLAGPNGWAVKRASILKRTAEDAMRDAETLAAAGEAGTVMAAPPRLPEDLTTCLRAAYDAAVRDPELAALAASTGRALEPISGAEAERTIARAEENVTRFQPVIREAVGRMKQ